jgi:hypothetical protein
VGVMVMLQPLFIGGCMKAITNFLSNTSLNAGQQIMLAVVTFVVLSLIAFFAKKLGSFFNFCFKALYKKVFEKLIKAYKDKHSRIRRLKTGKLSAHDYFHLEEKIAVGTKLTKLEEKAYFTSQKELEKTMQELANQSNRLKKIHILDNFKL